MRKIGVVTTSRSDYGIYFPILERIVSNPNLELLLYVTGMHLLSKFGNTVKIIEKDRFRIAEKIEIMSEADSPFSICQSIGNGTKGFAKVFRDNPPDILLVLGDRYEMHCVAVAAVAFNIPIAHIHGGEITIGAFDEQFRHSLTKLSHIHFAATEKSAKRLKQMGEKHENIIVSGAPALDAILKTRRYTKQELEKEFEISFSKPVFLVTFHPVTMGNKNTRDHILNLLKALSYYNDYNIVFTSPNADTNNKAIFNKIRSFVKEHNNSFFVDNFGLKGYLGMMEHAKIMVGNSSSGIIEASSFKLPVVNIGTRQQGREKPINVIDVGYSSGEIRTGINKALKDEFCKELANLENPYGDGKASERIVSILESINLNKIIKKSFCDYEEMTKQELWL